MEISQGGRKAGKEGKEQEIDNNRAHRSKERTLNDKARKKAKREL